SARAEGNGAVGLADGALQAAHYLSVHDLAADLPALDVEPAEAFERQLDPSFAADEGTEAGLGVVSGLVYCRHVDGGPGADEVDVIVYALVDVVVFDLCFGVHELNFCIPDKDDVE